MTPEERVAAAERRADEAEASARRTIATAIAKTTGLPDALADRLRGTTEQELRADAEQLLQHITGQAPARPTSFDSGARGGAPVISTSGQRAQEILARRAAAGMLPGYVPPGTTQPPTGLPVR